MDLSNMKIKIQGTLEKRNEFGLVIETIPLEDISLPPERVRELLNGFSESEQE